MRIIKSVIFIATLAAAQAFLEGDECGVTSSDFFKVDFGGDFRVAGGSGCDLAEDQKNCFCGVDYNDNDRLSEWKWQCNGAVEFGPAEGKVCPANIPVPKSLAVVDGSESALGVTEDAECDVSMHPTGQRGDPVCGYSDCDEGGNDSAICGCVNMTEYGMGEGMKWFCMHSTCSCSASNDDGSSNTVEGNSESASFMVSAKAAALVAMAALAALI